MVWWMLLVKLIRKEVAASSKEQNWTRNIVLKFLFQLVLQKTKATMRKKLRASKVSWVEVEIAMLWKSSY